MKRLLLHAALIGAAALAPFPSFAQRTYSYHPTVKVVQASAAGQSFFGMAVNRNTASPHYGLLYVCESEPVPRIRTYSYIASSRTWTQTPLSVSVTAGVPYDVAIAPDDSIWVLSSTKVVQSAPHPTDGTPTTATSARVTSGITAPRALVVTGDITNAKAYVQGSNTLEGWNITGGTNASMFSVGTGFSAGGITVDASGAVAVPIPQAARAIRRYNPDTGAQILPDTFAPLPPNADTAGLSLPVLDFIEDASYPGGGFYVVQTRLGASPYNFRVLRYDGNGAYLDGFGPADDIVGPYSIVNVPYQNNGFSNAYGAADNRGNLILLSKDGALALNRIVMVSNDANGPTGNPWGDVNADGQITNADALLVETYLTNPDSLTAAQKDRIRRYGDVNQTTNDNVIGNSVLNSQDTARILLINAGFIDAGTAGQPPAGYGDIDNDGFVSILDAVAAQRAIHGLGDPATIAIATTRGRGDISPTVPNIIFGDGVITQADADLIRARAHGMEANPPAYIDFWPMLAPTPDHPSRLPDTYTFTDIAGKSGDLMHQVTYQTQPPIEVNGHTVTVVKGTDNSYVGVYKGVDGSVYALYLKYPYAFGERILMLDSPMKILDAAKMNTPGATWSGETTSTLWDLGLRPVIYRATLLGRDAVYVPSAGAFTAPTDDPQSVWSQTARIRLDVGVLAGPVSQLEMQQAFFFDLMPFVGMIERGQASHMGSAAPQMDRPLLKLDVVTVRNRTYTEIVP